MSAANQRPGKERSPEQLILVVEDAQEIQELLSLVLEEAGYRVVTVGDGGQALAKAQSTRPDLITLDLALPGKNGWELLRELRDDPATRDTPILVISAYTRELEPALRRRITRIIPKPFYITQIVNEVNALLGKN